MKKIIAASVVTIFIAGCGLGNPSEPTETDVKRLNDHANGAPAANASSEPIKKVIDTGTWKLGKKEDLNKGIITGGEYTITAPEGSFGCYFEVVRNFGRKGDYIITNGNVVPGKVDIVEVDKKAKGLVLDGDCLAKKSK